MFKTKTPQRQPKNETVIFLDLTVRGMEIQKLIIRTQRSTKEGTCIQQRIVKVLIHEIERPAAR